MLSGPSFGASRDWPEAAGMVSIHMRLEATTVRFIEGTGREGSEDGMGREGNEDGRGMDHLWLEAATRR